MRTSFVLLSVLFCCTAFKAQVNQNGTINSSAEFNVLTDSVNQVWVSRYNGTGNDWDEAFAAAVDGSGNVYVTGGSAGTDLVNDYATIKYSSSGAQEWAARYNGTGNGDDKAAAIAVDGAGNVYVTGYSYGVSSSDFATIKYDAAGNEVWTARYNGTADNDDRATSIAVDNSGNVYVTGFSTGMMTDYDYVTIKYNSSGVEQWTAVYNGPGNWFDLPCTVAVDDSGNVLVAGWSSGSSGFNDYATVKYDAGGTEKWAARYHGPAAEADDACYDMAVDCWGNVYVTGGSVSEMGDRDCATIKYDPSGTEVWAARYDGPSNDFDVALALAADCDGNVYVTGKSAGMFTSLDFLTIKYNSSGVEEWTALYDGPANSEDGASAIAIDNSGNVYVTGNSMSIGSDFDYTTIKYSSSGTEEWVSRYNGPGSGADAANAIAVNGSGKVFVTGYSFDANSSGDYATVKYEEVIVPVELTSFTGRAVQNSVILNWTTATEKNNSGFEVERRKGSIASGEAGWEKIGFVGGSGTTSEPRAYIYTDENLSGKYSYRLKQIDFDGTYKYSNEVEVEVTVPAEFALAQNYPNPFNPTTTIKYAVPYESRVKISIYNMLGELVTAAVDEVKQAGYYEFRWNAEGYASGVYIYTLEAGGFTSVKKMLMVR